MGNKMLPSVMSHILSNKGLYNFLRANAHKSADLVERDGLLTAIHVADYVRDREIKSYVVSDSLCNALYDVDCGGVGPWHLRGVQAFHFIFKKNAISDGNHSYDEMFLTITPPDTAIGQHHNSSKDQYHVCISLQENCGAEAGDAMVYFGTKFKSGSTMEEMLAGASADIGGIQASKEFTQKVFHLALNLVLYVHTPDPDIMVLKPQISNTRSFRENYFAKSKDRDMVGIYSLGWDFHGREYTTNLTTRKGHFRWQPCGKLWSERKLIFLEATTVQYKTKLPESL